MNFDKSRVYTTLNAKELKIDSKVIVADNLEELKKSVVKDLLPKTIKQILPSALEYRFLCTDGTYYALAFLVEEPKEKQLKWTDLKIGDVITNGKCMAMVTAIDKESKEVHIFAGNEWFRDINLAEWVKVEE